MCQYGKAAIEAVNIMQKDNSIAPNKAWGKAIKGLTDSETSREKRCPQKAFLGLCEDGFVKGIPGGDYDASGLNKDYAIKAVNFLKTNPKLSDDKTKLWSKVVQKNHNGQMDVVLYLWNNNLIK